MQRFIVSLWIAAVVFSFATDRAWADDTQDQLKAILEARASSVVSVRAVIKTEMTFGGQSRDRESRVEFQGVIVDPSGLILCSSAPFATSMEDDRFRVKMTPVEFKVIIDKQEKEYDAFLVAKDTKLNLGFLQIREPGDLKLNVVDFSASAQGEIGQEVVSVNRLEKGYDYAAFLSTARIMGRIKKPRRALVFSGPLNGQGVAVFTLGGQPVGVVTVLETGLKVDEGGGGGMLGMLMGGSRGSGSSFILPGSAVTGLIDQARKRAQEMATKQAEKKDAAEKSDGPGEKPDEPEKSEDPGKSP